MPPAMRDASLVEREQWYEHFVTTDAGKKYLSDQWERMLTADKTYPVAMSPDGTFRIEDVPAGTYTVYIDVRGETSHDHPAGKVIARGQADFTVPEIPGGRSDRPLRIATVPIKVLPHVPSVGEMAPDFSVKTLAGKPLSLSQYRGKYVLLEFWASWCASCVGATAPLEEVYRKYASSGRIVMISLSGDDLPYAPSEFVRKHHLAWAQGFIGPDSPVGKEYGIEGIPSFWIIGPDGRIIAKPYYDTNVVAAVSTALGDTHAHSNQH